MLHTTLHGFIEVVCGSMFSGKTEELLRRVRRAQYARQKVQLFKPKIDDRFSEDRVQSHNASSMASTPVESSGEIMELLEHNTRVVGIDEAQFFDPEIVEVAQKLAYRGIQVIVAGLDLDFRGKPFGPMPELLAVAESVTKLAAVCTVCGHPASRSQRLIRETNHTNEDQIVVGASESYEARCRFCHEPFAIEGHSPFRPKEPPEKPGRGRDGEIAPESADVGAQ